MSFLKLAEERFSVRKFNSKKVEQEKIDQLLEAVRLAPTAANRQPQRILVIQGEEALEKLKDCTTYHFDAPLALLVCYDEERAWKREKYDSCSSGNVDVGIVGTHIMLAATDIGLGSTWVMYFDPVAIRHAYNIPEGYIPAALFPMGYPADGVLPGSLHAKSLPIDDMTFYDGF